MQLTFVASDLVRVWGLGLPQITAMRCHRWRVATMPARPMAGTSVQAGGGRGPPLPTIPVGGTALTDQYRFDLDGNGVSPGPGFAAARKPTLARVNMIQPRRERRSFNPSMAIPMRITGAAPIAFRRRPRCARRTGVQIDASGSSRPTIRPPCTADLLGGAGHLVQMARHNDKGPGRIDRLAPSVLWSMLTSRAPGTPEAVMVPAVACVPASGYRGPSALLGTSRCRLASSSTARESRRPVPDVRVDPSAIED